LVEELEPWLRRWQHRMVPETCIYFWCLSVSILKRKKSFQVENRMLPGFNFLKINGSRVVIMPVHCLTASQAVKDSKSAFFAT
jgi:hypothetical protein